MKIVVVGTGFLGLVQAAVCSEYGHEVHGYDIDSDRVRAYSSGKAREIERYVYEPGLVNLINETLGKYLFFTDDLASVIEGTDVFFFCLPTPTNPDGSTDLSYYQSALELTAKLLAKRKDRRRVLLVNRSTLPIGTVRYMEKVLTDNRVPNFGVASNPEFLAEGSAVIQARKPDRVVVGCDRDEDFQMLRRVYSQFVNHVRIKYIETTPETAEAIKYVANALLLNYISFWNGVGARIGENFPNIRIEDLRRGVTADERISTWGSYVSNGAGGRSFNHDVRSIVFQLQSIGVDTRILEASLDVNEFQKEYLVYRAMDEAGFSFRGKTIALLGLAFKKQTNDVSYASSLRVVELLLQNGVKQIRTYDPLALPEAQKVFDPRVNDAFQKISYHTSASEAIEGSAALFISTDWEEFRGLSAIVERVVSPPYLIIDGRRMIPDYQNLVQRGYTYLAVGSKLLKPEAQ
ncbi:MAG: UDP-glucose/GDP-mannose dehydrogenase family protein [Calditrichaeota bacterium]|nr:MAG: UDP-glucose/GDP-mannose dehydrogenase family protein [Calditrichota bacterium]